MKTLFTAILALSVSIASAQTAQIDSAAYQLMNEKDTVRLHARLDKLAKSNEENDVSAAIQYYITFHYMSQVDSLVRLAAKRFPNGYYAFITELNALNEEHDPVKQEELFKKLADRFPDKADSRELDYANGNIALNFAEHKNTEKALMHLNTTKSRSLFMLTMANTLLTYDPKSAADLMANDIDQYDSTRIYYEKVAYSKALLKLGRPSDALIQAKDAYEHLRPAKANNVTLNYGSALVANQQYDQALPFLQAVVVEGKSTGTVDSLLLSTYRKIYPGKNPNQYLDSLNQALIKNKTVELAATIKDIKCPNFTVTDEKGKKVSLADFRGKVIVLDFWATWCGPCKASFPAMQSVVNRYKGDPGVKFLFIHTEEFSKTPQKDAAEFLRSHHFDLPLYMDLRDPATQQSPAVSMFSVQGLPTKYIVDANGHIRFKLVGFESGTDKAHVAEVSAMIELARRS